MAKYRTLDTRELKDLEPEFVQFLVVNGITGDDWVDMKAQNMKKAELIIDQFSDVIMEGILRKIKFLQYRDKQVIRCFQCLENNIVMVALETSDEEADLTKLDAHSEIPDTATLSTQEKKYQPNRSEELWRMMVSGCEISDGSTFKALCLGL